MKKTSRRSSNSLKLLASRRAKLSTLLDLAKIRIAIPVALSCLTGYLLFQPHFSQELILVVVGILLIVGGASALNHIQEHKRDALMHRTRYRPIPSGKISSKEAAVWSILFLLSGGILLAWGGTPESILLALFSIAWYNLVYTPLKQITAFAVVPGALSGAFPPLIGWLGAGGEWFHPTILAVALFFFIGQIPHFWLLLMIHNEDYKRAGFKVLTDIFTPMQLNRITLVWTLATIVVALLLPSFIIISSPWLMGALAISSLWIFTMSFFLLIIKQDQNKLKGIFLRLNLFFLLVMILINLNSYYSSL
ncbi:MAG: protoheme IX farnesyltransferase [Marinifilaceae bacterium]